MCMIACKNEPIAAPSMEQWRKFGVKSRLASPPDVLLVLSKFLHLRHNYGWLFSLTNIHLFGILTMSGLGGPKQRKMSKSQNLWSTCVVGKFSSFEILKSASSWASNKTCKEQHPTCAFENRLKTGPPKNCPYDRQFQYPPFSSRSDSVRTGFAFKTVPSSRNLTHRAIRFWDDVSESFLRGWWWWFGMMLQRA